MKIVLIILLCLLMAGCAKITTPWGTYERFGPQQLIAVEILVTDPNDGKEILITFDKQDSDGYAEVIKMLIERLPK